MTQDAIRSAAAEGRLLLNGWVTLDSAYAVELMGEAGWDTVTVDQQHGLGGQAELVACLTGARASGLPALVRVAENAPGLVGRALDAGAQGVVCPLVGTAEDAERFVRSVKYPARGMRSWGPYRGKFLVEGEYFPQANDWTIACAQIETADAMANLDAILAVDGLDMALVGPNDLAIALTGVADIRAPAVLEAIGQVLEACRRHGVLAAIFANDLDYAKPLAAAGWDMLSVSTDAGLLGAAARETAEAVRAHVVSGG